MATGLNPLVAAAAPLLQLLGAAAQYDKSARPGRSARARGPRHAQFRAAHSRTAACRSEQLRPGALRAVRQHRRRRAEHALGQQRRLGRAIAGLDVSTRKSAAASASSSCWPDAAEPGPLPAGAGADVPLPVARVPGPVPAVAARPGRGRPAARGDLRDHRPPAADARARSVAALEGDRDPVSRRRGRRSGLGGCERRAGGCSAACSSGSRPGSTPRPTTSSPACSMHRRRTCRRSFARRR